MPTTFTTSPQATPVTLDERCARGAYLGGVIERAGNLLPSQGPITAFVFLNTLQALEDLPFEEGLAKGARLFGCQSYLPEERYREKLARGRIRREDLAAVVRENLQDGADVRICPLGTRYDLRMAMLQYPVRIGPANELRWFVAETDALTRLRPETPPAVRSWFVSETRHWVMRDTCLGGDDRDHRSPVPRDQRTQQMLLDLVRQFGAETIERWDDATWESLSVQALWRICRNGVHGVERHAAAPHPFVRHRDILLEATRDDSDSLVHEVLIRFCAAFADQGFSQWPLAHRDQGFYRAFCELYRIESGPRQQWLSGLAGELDRLVNAGVEPLESIVESLEILGVVEDEWDDYVTATLLALRGWAGMIRQMEIRSDRVAVPAPAGSLVEFLAVRLILERFALAHLAARSPNLKGPLKSLRTLAREASVPHAPPSVEQRAFLVFQVAQVLGWTPAALQRLSKKEWASLTAEVEAFSGLERRRVFHLAFERRLRVQALDAVSIHARREPRRIDKPQLQAVFCIDTREESFRRQLEEFAPSTETFGAAGFFSVPMYYRGVADAHFTALCPIVIKPEHWVVEDVVYTLEGSHRRRAKTRKALGNASHHVHVGSRSFGSGALLTAGLGVLASVPLVARVLFPRLTARIRRTAGEFVNPPPVTRLRLQRTASTPGPDGDQIGFSIDEMADISERLLRDIGLIDGFARLVMFIGHGSACLNNPHKSAYDCGACSGGAGGPNARALAAMLNHYRVREILARRGLEIPADTLFLGGLHNTCTDSVTFFDLDLLPKSHIDDYEAAQETLDQVCRRNAHERCRRFESAPLNLTYAAAHEHVEGRAEDLAQTRPEYGNATNAMCIVGRRARTRGLYLDRRSFLVSYDSTQDDSEHAILARILGAVVPVCEGINLQYFFSSIDSPGWGSGTKLPHNVTSLLGVMDGAASDLRTGLPWQGVEIHEPVRLLFVIETAPETMLQIMERNEVVGRILRNGWVQLAVLDPDSAEIQVYRGGRFVPYRPEAASLPQADSSVEWYRGWRDHLAFAEIAGYCPAQLTPQESDSERCSITNC